jgi:hypothetical protein
VGNAACLVIKAELPIDGSLAFFVSIGFGVTHAWDELVLNFRGLREEKRFNKGF